MHSFSKIWFAVLVSVLFTLSQVSAYQATALGNLWIVSTLVGFAYGNLFSLLPILTLEWFGLTNFSAVSGKSLDSLA